MLKPDLSQWVGREDAIEGGISADQAAAAHATLATDQSPAPQPGDAAPHLWHWTAFNHSPPMEALSQDGHPKRGGFLPPVNHPRRMWAGGDVQFHGPIHVGATLRKVSTIAAVDEKSDALTFVKVTHQIFEDDRLAVTESQDIVYLDIPDTFTPPKAKPAPTQTVFETPVDMSTAMLFRYSAITFNAHRIHYDLPYAQSVEKYPGLVVHGPLQATLLLGAAVRHAGRDPARFTYRGVHPMFHDHALTLLGHDEEPDRMRLCTAVPGAHQGMQATVIWKDLV